MKPYGDHETRDPGKKLSLGFLLLYSCLVLSFKFLVFPLPDTRAQCPFVGDSTIRVPDATDEDHFGFAVGIHEDILIASSPLDDNLNPNSGAVYVYRRSAGNWVFEQKLKASDAWIFDAYGESLDIRDNLIAVGTPREGDEVPDGGSVYLYRRFGQRWIEEQKISASDAALSDFFGWSIALDDDIIVVGSPSDDDVKRASGSAYVFRRTPNGWIEEHKLRADTQRRDAWFGSSVAIQDDLILVGARTDSRNGHFSGSVYVFRFDGTSWVLETRLTPSDAAPDQRFGYAVSFHGSRAAIGAPLAGPSREGAVYIFRHDDGNWIEEQTLYSSLREPEAWFGISLAIHERRLLVGAPRGDTPIAFLYRREDNGVWTSEQPLGNGSQQTAQFATSVDLDANFAVIGDFTDGGFGQDAGAVTVYQGSASLDRSLQGNVNRMTGSIQDVLFLNGKSGSRSNRSVQYNVVSEFSVEMKAPLSVPASATAPFALYAWLGRPSESTLRNLPFGIGCAAMPMPLVGTAPQPALIWNNAGRRSVLGRPNRFSNPAPTVLVRRPNGPLRAVRFFLQGVIYDPASTASVPASLTNGIIAVPVFGQ